MDVSQIARRLDVEASAVDAEEIEDLNWELILTEMSRQSPDTRLAFVAALSRAQAVSGECRVNDCYRSLFPVLDDDGLHWECNRPSSPHQSKPVVPKA